ncbi:Protein of unknown function [Gryllus bimaculatus]|nr:Protein of unknown function [Gryllus bimaculatus]
MEESGEETPTEPRRIVGALSATANKAALAAPLAAGARETPAQPTSGADFHNARPAPPLPPQRYLGYCSFELFGRSRSVGAERWEEKGRPQTAALAGGKKWHRMELQKILTKRPFSPFLISSFVCKILNFASYITLRRE